MRALVVCLMFALPQTITAADNIPTAIDARLQVELFAAEPDIVTPTGIAVDEQGRVLVIESHTHFRPRDYAGPDSDRIRVFEDTDGDGRADRISTFFEGTQSTMNLAIAPDGAVYVATRNEIFRLRDTDANGSADERTRLVHLETAGNYPHNGLSGFAFDFQGNLYFGFGENLGADFKIIGSDGTTLSEQEGGHIYRYHSDGSGLERWAVGFWNPFHLAFDAYGRLFAVDNDPDSLPPCRLLHVVPGGNYGYRFRNGRQGRHPFTAWNGELPGTLPMVAGTGEAPSGIVAYESDNLPDDYRGELLVTSWGDHRLERYRLQRRGASFRSRMVPFVAGGEDFRPVGIAVAPDGSLFISDWVDKSYEVHGRGRLWRIRAKEPHPLSRPSDPREAIRSAHRPLRERAARQLAIDKDAGIPLLRELAVERQNPQIAATAVLALASVGDEALPKIALAVRESIDLNALALEWLPQQDTTRYLADSSLESFARAALLRTAHQPEAAEFLWKSQNDPDPFVQQAGRRGLQRAQLVSATIDLARLGPKQRLACVHLLREAGDPEARQRLPELLRDADPDARLAAVQWVGEEKLTEYRQEIVAALESGATTPRLFAACLAALERLDRGERSATDEWSGEQYVAQTLLDPQSSPVIRRWALRTIRPDHPSLTLEVLQQFLKCPDPVLQLEAVRTLRENPQGERVRILRDLARDEGRPVELRAEAIVGLSAIDPADKELLLELASAENDSLRDEALRSLRGAELSPDDRQRLSSIKPAGAKASELIDRVLAPVPATVNSQPYDIAPWLELLEEPGNPAAGERVFFHAQSGGCYRCHQINGRGGQVGPDLTTIGRSLDRRRLVDSIVNPSREIAPQFTSWRVTTSDGRIVHGVLLEESGYGEQVYGTEQGQVIRLSPDEIDQRRAASTSIMPSGLGDLLTPQEFRDLMAFLLDTGDGS